MNLFLFNRRFSGGFGSRDYRTSQSGSGGSTRPGGSVGGPRTSGGGSYPNYSAPPPTHGTKNKKTKQNSLGYTSDSNSECFLLLFSLLLPSACFPISFADAARSKTKKKIKNTETFPSLLGFQLSLLGFVAFLYISLTVWSAKIIQRVQGVLYFFCFVYIILKRSAPTGTLMLPALSWESS